MSVSAFVEGALFTVVAVAFFVACIALGVIAMDSFFSGNRQRGAMTAALGVFVLAIGGGLFVLLVESAPNPDEEGPCLRYDQRATFDPATKMTRSYRVCVERGEWLE